jgi:8-oxo-dGTP pyrophosphatase MutT (NUDIX family)
VDTLDSREVYRNAWMSVREDRVRRADGSDGIYGVVDKPDFALVIPRDEHGLWLVEQYRYPVRRRAWEFPQGSWGNGTSGSPVELAAAELREETGLRAEHVRHLGHLYGAYGFCSQGFDVYVATGLTSRRPGPRSDRAGHASAARERGRAARPDPDGRGGRWPYRRGVRPAPARCLVGSGFGAAGLSWVREH